MGRGRDDVLYSGSPLGQIGKAMFEAGFGVDKISSFASYLFGQGYKGLSQATG
jgi:hypothetical protein